MHQNIITLQELAKLTRSTLIGDPNYQISGVETLQLAALNDASFLANSKYTSAMERSKAGVICVDTNTPTNENRNFLVSVNPSHTFQLITQLLLKPYTPAFTGIHPTAVIHETASIAKNITIGPYAVIEAHASVSEHSIIYPHVYIGAGSRVGKHCVLYPHASIREGCILNNHVIIQQGGVIGSCGYGYITDPQTGVHTKIDQLGIVILEDYVEIGANTTIDRARFKHTYIKCGTKIDNLVQVGHNVELGKNNLVVSQTGIAGSSKTGDNVYFGGQAGVVGHITICNNVKIATRGGVSKNINTPGVYGGTPVIPMIQHNKNQVLLRNISDIKKKLSKLEKTLDMLQNI